MVFVKKQAVAAAATRALNASQAIAANANASANGIKRQDGDQPMQDATAEVAGEIAKRENAEASGSQQPSAAPHAEGSSTNPPAPSATAQPPQHPPTDGQSTYAIRQAWEHVDEVVQILKTAFPLLILSMETMVDQVLQRFKATPEEEIYRLICMLLQDAIQVGIFLLNHELQTDLS